MDHLLSAKLRGSHNLPIPTITTKPMALTPPKNQPETIEFNGHTYELYEPWEPVDEEKGIAEGPLYKVKDSDPYYLFMPDLSYLMGITSEPSVMHRIYNGD